MLLLSLSRIITKLQSLYFSRQENAVKAIKLGDWLVKLSEDSNMVIPKEFVVEWIMSDDTKSYGALQECSFNRGVILGLSDESAAALTVCGKEVMGMVYSGGIPYFVEPLNESTGEHLMYPRCVRKIKYRCYSVRVVYHNIL